MSVATVTAKGLKNPIFLRLIANCGEMSAERNSFSFGIFPCGRIQKEIGMMVVRIDNQRA